MPWGITYNPYPPRLWGICQPLRLCYMIFRILLNKWPSQNFYRMHLDAYDVRGGGGGIPPITLTLKKGTRTSDFQSNEYLRSLYDHSFHKNLIFPRSISNNPCAEGCGGVPQRHNVQTFQLRLTEGLPQNFY